MTNFSTTFLQDIFKQSCIKGIMETLITWDTPPLIIRNSKKKPKKKSEKKK